MTQTLLAILVFGAFAGMRLFGRRRTITPKVADARPERPMTVSVRREAPERTRAEAPTTTPVLATTPVAPSGYLLGGERPDGAPDTMAAVMNMMSGPGICTPRMP